MVIKQNLSIKILMITLGALLILLPFAGCAAAPEPTPAPGEPTPAPKEPIIFADLGWDSAQVHNRIAAFILENGYGYPKSDMVPGDTIPLFAGLDRGDVDVNMECWIPNQQEAYDKAIAAGHVVDLGINFPDSWQGWLVPTHMIESGDLPAGLSVEDMPNYWEPFKDPEDPDKGRFVNSLPGWECTGINSKKLEAYGLDEYYNDFIAGSSAALSGSMAAACQKGEPWFGYYWAPTWVLGKLDMTKIEEPPYDKEIFETTAACAYPLTGVNIVVNAEFHAKASPELSEFLKKYGTTQEQNNKFLAYMNDTEGTTEEAAIWFLQNYEDVWTEWVPSDVASKVKAALP